MVLSLHSISFYYWELILELFLKYYKMLRYVIHYKCGKEGVIPIAVIK